FEWPTERVEQKKLAVLTCQHSQFLFLSGAAPSQWLPADDYRLVPVRYFSSCAFLAAEAFAADASASAIASALAMARAATGFSHSNAMKAAVMSQAIMT